MLLVLVAALVAITKTGATGATDEEKSFTYNVAVVEYQPVQNLSLLTTDRLNLDTNELINLLKNVEEDLDLILFPESVLAPGGGVTSISTEVPEPFSKAICNSNESTEKYKDFLRKFSCAAIEFNTTIVINLIEKVNCTTDKSSRYCQEAEIIYHNTDVAFNENGQVIGRYRKWNLFGEYGITPADRVEVVTIKTKNNDVFGLFTCFDIQFGQPALNLTRNMGIRNILFPNRWFSELPYLTSLQVQQMWAEENDVNLLSSGANNPSAASGGSGIYIGKDGPLVREIISGVGGSSVFVKRVPRIEIENNPYKVAPVFQDQTDALAKEMDSFDLWIDTSISGHSSVVLNTSKSETNQEVCNGENIQICCQFNVKVSINESVSTTNKVQYIYHLAAFNGIRTYSGLRDGGIETCGLLACLNETISSCGQRFPNYADIAWPIIIESVKVVANFTKDENRIQFPNSLLSSIRPISPTFTTWQKEEIGDMIKRTHVLNKPTDRLLTFGIFGRDFNRDSEVKKPNSKSETNCLSSIFIICFMFLFSILLRRTN